MFAHLEQQNRVLYCVSQHMYLYLLFQLTFLYVVLTTPAEKMGEIVNFISCVIEYGRGVRKFIPTNSNWLLWQMKFRVVIEMLFMGPNNEMWKMLIKPNPMNAKTNMQSHRRNSLI